MPNKPLATVSTIILALSCCATASATSASARAAPQKVSEKSSGSYQSTTFEFATHGTQKLYLDRIVDKNVKMHGKRPVLIYSFGGGWETGARNEQHTADFFQHLASLGYVVISIDYRRYIIEAKAKGELKGPNIMDVYLHAIEVGVEDLYDATAYVVRNADRWNIDPKQIVIMGSSAGATNSLIAEYNVANGTALAKSRLPEGFRYAGVIAMAGAFWLNGKDTPLDFKSKPAPIMFFHGPKDQLVTYDEDHRVIAGYGPAYYTRKFAGPDYPKWFVDVVDGDHVMSSAPMWDYRYEIDAFLQKLVRERQALSIHTVEVAKIPKNFLNLQKLYGDRLNPRPAVAPKK